MKRKLENWIFSLQGKFILTAFLCILGFTVIGSLILLSREKALFRQNISNQGEMLATISRLMLTNVMIYNELGMMTNQDLVDFLDYFILNLMERDKRVQHMVIVDQSGEVIAHSDISEYGKNYSEDTAINDVLKDLKTKIIFDDYGKNKSLIVTTPLNINTKNWGVLKLSLSTKTMRESIRSAQAEVIELNLLFSVISLVIISFGARVLAKPVKELAKVMDGIKTHGDLESQNVTVNVRRDEIGDLQKSFLWMLRRLKEADDQEKKTTEILSRTEKMVSIGRLASGVAHEINNPLSGIELCFENLLTFMSENKKQKPLIDAIKSGHQKIKNIVEQLLCYSSNTITEKISADLNEQLDNVYILIQHTASKQNIKIVKDYKKDKTRLYIDVNKISQVILNVTLNAIQAMDSGGTLTISTRLNDPYCTLCIKDTGHGISPEILPNIFDPFFTTKVIGEGTGLGLSVSKMIVEQHGGYIDVESHVGEGTTFRINLPLS